MDKEQTYNYPARIPVSLAAQLTAKASENERSLNKELVVAIRYYLSHLPETDISTTHDTGPEPGSVGDGPR